MYPNSIREQLLQNLLHTLRPVADAFQANLYRSPTVAIERKQCPALIVSPEEETVSPPKGMLVERVLKVRVVALTREVGENVAEAVADQLIVASHAALMANRNLNGLCQGIKELGTDWDIEDADATVASMTARYQIEYRTAGNDLTKKA
jgi:hypothetical protein